MTEYHIPALLEECISGLNIKPEGIYVDVTFGGGGHSKAILDKLKKGKLFAFDQDKEALDNTISDKRFTLINGNFRYIKNFLRYYGIHQVDGILADLGISFHQVDELSRGFSYKSDSEIDMRMNTNSGFSARKVINEYSPEKLSSLFKEYGELNNSWKMAQEIVKYRTGNEIKTIAQFIGIIEKFAPKKMENKFYAKVFQALRIEVNHEMEALKEFLEASPELLSKNGRLVIISYHSLEDRLVKNFIKSGNFKGTVEKDIFGHFKTSLNAINKKIIVPSDEEIMSNPRSRSAKLRIAEKN